MDFDKVQKVILLSVIISISILLLPNRRWWIRPWIHERNSRGNISLSDEFNNYGDLESYTNFLRMDKERCSINFII